MLPDIYLLIYKYTVYVYICMYFFHCYFTAAIVNNGQCLCYSGTTCPSGGGIDIRIVNTVIFID